MKYGSRKFIIAVLALVSADAFLALGSITAQVWSATVGSVLALYAIANVGQKWVQRESGSD